MPREPVPSKVSETATIQVPNLPDEAQEDRPMDQDARERSINIGTPSRCGKSPQNTPVTRHHAEVTSHNTSHGFSLASGNSPAQCVLRAALDALNAISPSDNSGYCRMAIMISIESALDALNTLDA
ncbi:hypothetical protein KSP40_PGU001284 [Platanthera guangdongensis]|uniref:Uncharacterized protein n=1 Tax=Platanthera guangdongensis TaxID=2320717 RepID=A0ABR2LSS2_9ASPA